MPALRDYFPINKFAYVQFVTTFIWFINWLSSFGHELSKQNFVQLKSQVYLQKPFFPLNFLLFKGKNLFVFKLHWQFFCFFAEYNLKGYFKTGVDIVTSRKILRSRCWHNRARTKILKDIQHIQIMILDEKITLMPITIHPDGSGTWRSTFEFQSQRKENEKKCLNLNRLSLMFMSWHRLINEEANPRKRGRNEDGRKWDLSFRALLANTCVYTQNEKKEREKKTRWLSW